MITSSHFFNKQLFIDDESPEDIDKPEVGPWNKIDSSFLMKRVHTQLCSRSINVSKSREKVKTSQNEDIKKVQKQKNKKVNKKTQRLDIKDIVPSIRLPFISKTPFQGSKRSELKHSSPRKLRIIEKKREQQQPRSLKKQLKHIPLLRQLNFIRGRRKKQTEQLIKSVQEKLNYRKKKSLAKSNLFVLLPKSK